MVSGSTDVSTEVSWHGDEPGVFKSGSKVLNGINCSAESVAFDDCVLNLRAAESIDPGVGLGGIADGAD